jgi:hypothetical protein
MRVLGLTERRQPDRRHANTPNFSKFSTGQLGVWDFSHKCPRGLLQSLVASTSVSAYLGKLGATRNALSRSLITARPGTSGGALRRCSYKACSRQHLAPRAGRFAFFFCVFLLKLTLVLELRRARLDLATTSSSAIEEGSQIAAESKS